MSDDAERMTQQTSETETQSTSDVGTVSDEVAVHFHSPEVAAPLHHKPKHLDKTTQRDKQTDGQTDGHSDT